MNTHGMIYNTQMKRIPLPEYGRNIQSMVEYCLTLEDREARQKCAETIIKCMGNVFPALRDSPDAEHVLWDHLAVMSDFKLDIDYPFDVVNAEQLKSHPKPMEYPGHKFSYRHYGATIERLIAAAVELPDGEDKFNLTMRIANLMKRDYVVFNKATSDAKIEADLEFLSQGRLGFDYDTYPLLTIEEIMEKEPETKAKSKKKK